MKIACCQSTTLTRLSIDNIVDVIDRQHSFFKTCCRSTIFSSFSIDNPISVVNRQLTIGITSHQKKHFQCFELTTFNLLSLYNTQSVVNRQHRIWITCHQSKTCTTLSIDNVDDDVNQQHTHFSKRVVDWQHLPDCQSTTPFLVSIPNQHFYVRVLNWQHWERSQPTRREILLSENEQLQNAKPTNLTITLFQFYRRNQWWIFLQFIRFGRRVTWIR